MNKKHLKLGIAVLVALVLTVVLLINIKKDTTKDFSFDTVIQEENTAFPNSYINSEAGFEISYPRDWELGDVVGEDRKKTITMSGAEGEISLSWGEGFGGACPDGYIDVPIADETLKGCKSIVGEDEVWSNIYKEFNDQNFSAILFIREPHDANRDMVMQVFKTLRFLEI